MISAALTSDDRQVTSVRIASAVRPPVIVAAPVTPAIVAVTPACPKCQAELSLLLYRGFSRAILMCEACEHIWQADVDSHVALKSAKPSAKP